MVEPSQNEENKSKVQIPEESKALIAAPPEPNYMAAAAAAQQDDEYEGSEQGERRNVDKIIDQRASNIPIQNPDMEDLIELLTQTAE